MTQILHAGLGKQAFAGVENKAKLPEPLQDLTEVDEMGGLAGLKMRRSSRYPKTKSVPEMVRSMSRWKVSPAFLSPKGILVNSQSPNGVVTAVFLTSSGSIGI